MLNIKTLRTDRDRTCQRLVDRVEHPSEIVDQIIDADDRRRRLQTEVDRLSAERKELARQRPTSADQVLRTQSRVLGDRMQQARNELRVVAEGLDSLLLRVPNFPHPTVPRGVDNTGNEVVRTWGVPRDFAFVPRPHWEIGLRLGLDEKRGAAVSGSGFYFLTGDLAMLEIGLVHFMLDTHRARGYRPTIVPDLINRDAMVSAGQLPKFADQLYEIERDGLYLVPTAESALAAMYRGEILDGKKLPEKLAAFSPCFRREAGAAGVDNRGILRVHQFHKVELFTFTTPECSEEALEAMTMDAEAVLRQLELPYRVVLLCRGDMGFAAAKTYDIEVWLPSQTAGTGGLGTYREISSCSNVTDFQARRGNIRYRANPDAKPEYVHMLNGSGLAVGRTMVAILENCQEEDGSVVIPVALRHYVGTDRIRPV